MSFSFRIFLLLVAFFIGIGPLEANHLSSQGHSGNHHHQNNRTNQELMKYNRQLLQAYDQYRKKSAQVWGKEAVMPDAKTDVTYRNNFKQRSIIDYEQGKVQVELALRPETASDHTNVKKSLASAVEKTIFQGPDGRSIIDIAKHPEPPATDQPPVLAGLIADEDGSSLAPDKIEKFKQAKTRTLNKRTITGHDGKKRIIYSTQFALVPDHIKRRAQRFSQAVDRNAMLHRIPTALIYAIMETESFFNPTAKSPVPAFGLMQLVPATGARDAYKYLYAKDTIVKEHYLYNPSHNIELGVAYLHILYFRYFKQIRDPQSRQWATIAAYNTGFQNVIKTFAGDYDNTNHSSRWIWKMRAMNKINRMKPEQMYRQLRENLPAKETRDYIKKVRERMGKYQI
jgi:membrane-bound lytic murein transglycosylase C